MSTEDWGWKITKFQLFPVPIDLSPIPQSHLQLSDATVSLTAAVSDAFVARMVCNAPLPAANTKGLLCTSSSNTVD